MDSKDQKGGVAANGIPEYLKHWPGLSVREGDRIVDAAAEDVAVAQLYPTWQAKGSVSNGKRLTILTRKVAYAIDEEIRVLHVVEINEPGHELFVMGPKPVSGEYVDGQLRTPPASGSDPLRPDTYDGATVASPGVDYNYEITCYRFSEAGTHQIVWKPGSLESNTVTVQIGPN
jgi:hypothetical protein